MQAARIRTQGLHLIPLSTGLAFALTGNSMMRPSGNTRLADDYRAQLHTHRRSVYMDCHSHDGLSALMAAGRTRSRLVFCNASDSSLGVLHP